MNFEIICSNCGAPSSPTIGVCPYCKAVMTTEDEHRFNESLLETETIKKELEAGRIELKFRF